MAVHVPAATCQFVSCSVRQGSAPPRDAPPRAMDVPICGESPPPTHTPGAHTAHWRVERPLCMVVQTSYLIRSHMCVSVRVSLSVCVICLRSASTPKKVKVLTTTSSGHTDNTTDGANLLHVRAGDEYDLASLHTGAAGGWRPGSRKRSLEIRCSVQYRGAPLSHSTSPR